MNVDPQVPNSPPAKNPFAATAVDPKAEPFVIMEAPDHISYQMWQASAYDATSDAPMGAFVQRPSGKVDPATGQLTGEPFASTGRWRQV